MDSATQSPSKVVVWMVQSETSPTDQVLPTCPMPKKPVRTHYIMCPSRSSSNRLARPGLCDCAIADTRDVSVLDESRSRSVKSIESAVRGITRGLSRARRLHPDIFHFAPLSVRNSVWESDVTYASTGCQSLGRTRLALASTIDVFLNRLFRTHVKVKAESFVS